MLTATLTEQDLEGLVEQAQQQGQQLYRETVLGTQCGVLKQYGQGSNRHISLRGGLTLEIFDGQFWQPMGRQRHHEATFPISAKFCLAGDCRVKTANAPEIGSDYEEAAGCNYLYHLPELTELEEYPAETTIQTVMIYAYPDYFQTLNPAKECLPLPLQHLMNRRGRFHQSLGKTTLAMTQVLQQILHCPYQGVAQQLYLESKALELLALQFTQLEADLLPPKQSPLSTSDLERVQYAKDILIQQFDTPLSLKELTYQVGLSDRKLKQGFRHLFGTTVLGYLYDYRMEQAQQLLHCSYMTIAEVALKVGYRNPEAFSTAFRRKFSISPKAYQLSQRK